MKYIPDPITTNCTGCMICKEKCPKQCIEVTTDPQGFLYPRINKDLCIACGLCESSCPSNHSVAFNSATVALSCWSLSESEHKTCTSGGIASVLSRLFLQAGGVVYGCSYIAKQSRVMHIRIDRMNDLWKLKGSKYVQSSLEQIRKILIEDLKKGNKVLFIGTPCQVAGIKRLAGNYIENLITIDLVCHGVPSEKMLFEHIDSLHLGRNIDFVSFRDSNSYCLKLFSKSEMIYEKNISKKNWSDIYLNAFYKSLIIRKCCYLCQYAKSERVGDLTLGDFWGLGKKGVINQNSEDGVSLVLPNTEKGKSLLLGVEKYIYCEKRPVEEAIEGNEHLRKHSIKTWRTHFFYYLYPRIPFKHAVRISAADWILGNYVKRCIKRMI